MTTPRKGATRGEIPLNLTVDEAVAETVHRTPGFHPKEVAALIGRTHRYVLDVADELRDAELKVSEIAPLVNGTGNPLVLDVIERQVGRVAYDVPIIDPSDADVMTRCASVLKETSDVVREIAGCAGTATIANQTIDLPRVITTIDAARIRREGEEAIRAILSAVAFVDAKAGGLR